MRKTFSFIPSAEIILFAFYPVCKLIGSIFGYDFILYSYPAFAIIISVLAVICAALTMTVKFSASKFGVVLSAAALPVSILYGIIMVFCSSWSLCIVFALVSAVCSFIIFMKFASSLALKITMGIISAVLAFVMIIEAMLVLLVEGFGATNIIAEYPSPNGSFTAVLIDSDQGALGGDTYVDVTQNKKLNLIIGEFSKAPIRVYSGDWGEFENIEIEWENDNALLINGKFYDIGTEFGIDWCS